MSEKPGKKHILSPLNAELQAKRKAASKPIPMIKFFIVLPLEGNRTGSDTAPKKRELEIIGSCVSCLWFDHFARLDSVEVKDGYVLLGISLSPDDAPADFAYAFIDQCDHLGIAVENRYLSSALVQPTDEAIEAFLNE